MNSSGSAIEGGVEAALERALRGPSPLLAPGLRVLVACSGGADSVALAAGLAEAARGVPEAGIGLSLGHVDHGLRSASAAEALAVRALAGRLGVPFHLARLEGLEAAIAAEGLEAAARDARYRALLGLAREAGAAAIATAHTRRDQAETVLLRLARGGGPGALAGVRARARLGELWLLRPLLSVPRSATEEFCAARGLPFVLDPHNADPARARTRVRAAFATLSAQLNPRLEEALAGAAALAADEDDLLAAQASAALSAARRPAGGGSLPATSLAASSLQATSLQPTSLQATSLQPTSLQPTSVPALLALHPALLRRALLALAAEAGARPERIHLESLAALLNRHAEIGTPAQLDLPRGRARIAGGLLLLEGAQPVTTAAPGAPPAVSPATQVAIAGPGRYAWRGMTLQVSTSEGSAAEALLIDESRAPFPWTLRGHRPGDRFRPGGGHTKKVSELWIDARVPRERRRSLALLSDASGTIFHVEGLRPGDAARGPLARPIAIVLLDERQEMDRDAARFPLVQRLTSPHATMTPHRPDEEPR